MRLTQDYYPFGVMLKTFYDVFLAPLSPAEAQPYTDVYTWWRHATMCAASASAWAHSGLQVSTTQLLSPELHGTHDGWAQEQAKRIFVPLRAVTHPLSSVTFQASMDQLHTNLATQHTIQEAQELLAQHTDCEA